MAAADLMVVIVAVILQTINNIYLFAHFLLITPICAVIDVLRAITMDCSVWFTVAFTSDRGIAICCQKLRERYCTERVATKVIATVGALSCVRCVPLYFAVEPYVIINNIPWRCVEAAKYYTASAWKIYEILESVTTPLLPICFVLLFNALTIKHILAANRVRRGLRKSLENQKDAEVESRRKSMILLFGLSANFILLWMPYIVHSVNWQTENYFYIDRSWSTPIYILQQLGSLFRYLSICTNTCIYGLTQRKFREELKSGAKYLFTLNGRICN
ncbi:probable G-protein coupled receptor 139 [Hypanus sabinus]|uniref:probable G-protein coupled receptor 139 n=1 Tax=Hypanus sabinus TaxID=79690 RepID=UPI0028C409C1|nr:probable G-protein coupled receptor 139 [Hypanus sabinus]